jgi:hypothetical protein
MGSGSQQRPSFSFHVDAEYEMPAKTAISLSVLIKTTLGLHFDSLITGIEENQAIITWGINILTLCKLRVNAVALSIDRLPPRLEKPFAPKPKARSKLVSTRQNASSARQEGHRQNLESSGSKLLRLHLMLPVTPVLLLT